MIKPSSRESARRFCCYKGCSSDKLTTRDGAISFFSFPMKDTERCSKWISNCGREEFRYLTPRELSEKRVCEFHFDDAMFSNPMKINLLKRAIPKVHKDSPELIHIDEDSESECESGIVSEESTININDNNNSINEEVSPTNRSILVSVLTNGNEHSNYRNSTDQNISVNTKNNASQNTNGSAENFSSNSNQNTKFHNLPPETTTTDFYFQHCSESAEETNHSLPEPDEFPAELPLFVQQNSVVSLAEEPAPSEVSEPPPKRRKRDKDDHREDSTETMRHLRNISDLLVKNDDEFEIFGRSVAVQLKKMSLRTALKLQAKIQSLLSLHRIEDIEREAKEKSELKGNQAPSNSNASSKDETTEETKAENSERPDSPSLLLTCASEHSDNEIVE